MHRLRRDAVTAHRAAVTSAPCGFDAHATCPEIYNCCFGSPCVRTNAGDLFFAHVVLSQILNTFQVSEGGNGASVLDFGLEARRVPKEYGRSVSLWLRTNE